MDKLKENKKYPHPDETSRVCLTLISLDNSDNEKAKHHRLDQAEIDAGNNLPGVKEPAARKDQSVFYGLPGILESQPAIWANVFAFGKRRGTARA
jgi:hypothetical protein